MNKITGKLFICPTPLGNLEDITLRVIRVLKEVDVVAAEDTRRTRQLLAHLEISKRLISCHQHSNNVGKIIPILLSGKQVALVSDAGTPGISDPGRDLVVACWEAGLEIDPLPGPNAAVTALSACGFPLARFTYLGFLPRKGLDKAVAQLKAYSHPVVIYESPARIAKLLELLAKHMPNRELLVARELTKVHQQLERGTARQLLTKAQEFCRGEITVVLGPWEAQERPPSAVELTAMINSYIEGGMTTRDAVDKVCQKTGLPRREVYKQANKKNRT